MGVSSVNGSTYYPNQAAGQASPAREAEGERLSQALRERQDAQPTLVEMMKQAEEKAQAAAKRRDELLKQTRSSRRYGDSAMTAYAKLARARNSSEVDAASGYARRQIAQLRAAKLNDSENADRIQAAINQLQKAVNRAGRKKRELSQEKASAARQARLEKEKRQREAKRLRHELRRRQAQRMIRESGYLREADTDNRLQDQLASSKQELRDQMRELSAAAQTQLDSAIQGYAASTEAPPPSPEISVEA